MQTAELKKQLHVNNDVDMEKQLDENHDKSSVLPKSIATDAIIRKRVYIAMGIGFIPIPLVDFASLTVLQLEMVRALCRAHDIPFKKSWVLPAISSLVGGSLAVGAVPLISSLAKSIPVIGMTLGATSVVVAGAASTYAIGKAFDHHFHKGGNLESFNAAKCEDYFKEKLEEGKEYVKSFRKTKPSDVDTTVDASSEIKPIETDVKVAEPKVNKQK